MVSEWVELQISVVNATTGRPIEAAAIRIALLSRHAGGARGSLPPVFDAVTDGSGTAAITNLRPGRYTFQVVSAPDEVAIPSFADVDLSSDARLDVRLSPSVRISGTLFLAGGGPLPGPVFLQAYQRTGQREVIHKAAIDTNGRFQITRLSADLPATISARAPGTHMKMITVTPVSETTGVDITLDPVRGGIVSIRGRVVVGGAAQGQVTVRAESSEFLGGYRLAEFVKTTVNGEYAIHDLPPAIYVLTACIDSPPLPRHVSFAVRHVALQPHTSETVDFLVPGESL
jgi:hypothetical protein